MKLPVVLACAATLFLSSSLSYADEHHQTKKLQGEKQKSLSIEELSESFGHIIGKNIESLGVDFDINQVIKGIHNRSIGKNPTINENDCIQAISKLQEESFQKQAKINLKLAEDFLAKNSSKQDIISLEEGKVQYKIEKQGKGDIVQAHATPTIKYTGKFADGHVFGSSQDAEPLALDDAIPGFAKAIVGMKEGEKRTVYIHPQLGYGASGYLPPNSLLTFEVEVVKAATPQQESKKDQSLEELAEIDIDAEKLDELKALK